MTNQDSSSTSDEPPAETVNALDLTRDDIERMRSADDVLDELPEHPADIDPHEPVACPLCGGAGLVPSMLPELLRPAHDRETCPDCGGIGMVLSGSRVPEHMIQVCTTCNGSGFKAKAPTYELAPLLEPREPAEPAQQPPPFVIPDNMRAVG